MSLLRFSFSLISKGKMLDVGQLCFKVIFPDQRRSFIINFTKLVLSFCTKTLKLKPFSGSWVHKAAASALASVRSGTIMMRELEIAINFNHVGIWDPSLIPCSLGFKLSSGIFFSYALQLVRQNRALRAFSQCFELPKRSQSLFEIVLATCIMPMQFHKSVLNSGFLRGTNNQ